MDIEYRKINGRQIGFNVTHDSPDRYVVKARVAADDCAKPGVLSGCTVGNRSPAQHEMGRWFEAEGATRTAAVMAMESLLADEVIAR